jgi:carboxymethylenebutenolidase
MSRYETLMARDGHTFSTYMAKPAGKARGGSIIVQEMFGLTDFICRVADRCAAEGYLTLAPALFDRIGRDLVLDYSPEDGEEAHGLCKQIATPKALLDIAAAAAVTRHVGKLAVIGFSWGARLAWAAASELSFGAAICYYAEDLAQELPRTPRCPTMLHFGAEDASIPPREIEQVRAAFPQGIFHLYASAGHEFSNEDRPELYNAEAAALAQQRSFAFMAQHLG